MFEEPAELPRSALLAELNDGWGIVATDIAYAPVGFGSHHWMVGASECRWFVTVDDLNSKRRSSDEALAVVHQHLAAALSAAAAARGRGLTFVVAPVPDSVGNVVRRLLTRYSVAVYPFIDGHVRTWVDDYRTTEERLVVLDLVVPLHATENTGARSDDLAIPRRADLAAAMGDTTDPWNSGPYGERARRLLGMHAAGTERLLRHYDRLATAVLEHPERMVLTHGEPHPGNTIVADGAVLLVDWDTALVAPPERDLWTVAGSDRAVLDAYTAATGRPVDDAALDCYRLWFDLAEIAGYITIFRDEHDESTDVQESWKNLNYFLDPSGRWPHLT